MLNSPLLNFKKLATYALISVYVLILIGACVRSTGAGMGCPDWPKCFGRWVPPTQESQLPPNYREIYKDRGYEHLPFNAVKTWTEYLNRLSGVVVGFLILATCIASFPLRKSHKLSHLLSILALFLVIFEGWMGAVVVKTNLKPIAITLHMFLALMIVILLSLIRHLLQDPPAAKQKSFLTLLSKTALVITGIQILFGTQVRQKIDEISVGLGGSSRDLWVSLIGGPFYLHRSFSWTVMLVTFFLVFRIRKDKAPLQKQARLLTLLVGLEILLGMTLAYFHFPAAVQPLHLLLALGIFGLELEILLQLK